MWLQRSIVSYRLPECIGGVSPVKHKNLAQQQKTKPTNQILSGNFNFCLYGRMNLFFVSLAYDNNL